MEKSMIDPKVWWYEAIPEIVEYQYLKRKPVNKIVRVEEGNKWVEFHITPNMVEIKSGVLDGHS